MTFHYVRNMMQNSWGFQTINMNIIYLRNEALRTAKKKLIKTGDVMDKTKDLA